MGIEVLGSATGHNDTCILGNADVHAAALRPWGCLATNSVISI
jgi:uncharacterized Fe-S cluster protein YjdI